MKILKEAGQSTVEFIFCFIFGVSIILLVFNSAINYTTGYIVHYATFMASRVFMAQSSYYNTWNEGNRAEAVQAAKDAFASYRLDIIGVTNDGFNITDTIPASAGEYLMIGGYTQFERKMDVIGQLAGQSKLQYISESYLGREPSRGICAQRVCKAVTGQTECSESMDVTLFDDGC